MNLTTEVWGKKLDIITGELLDYPKTAVTAFGDQNLIICLDYQDRVMKSEGLPEFMPAFRFSKKLHKDIIKVLKD